MSQTIAESTWEEGRLKGQAEGELKGELKALRRALRQLLVERFADVPEGILQQIESCNDVERLTAAVTQVLHLGAPEGLQI